MRTQIERESRDSSRVQWSGFLKCLQLDGIMTTYLGNSKIKKQLS